MKDADEPCTDYTVVSGSTSAWGTAGQVTWYVVLQDTTIDQRITVTGTVHLILCDGAKLTASAGIEVAEGNTLNIYAQSESEEMGELTATGGRYKAGIGGGSDAVSGGTINIHGGKVTATGKTGGAGIGGGTNGSGGSITIYGGTVTAKGRASTATDDKGAGIGSGYGAPNESTNSVTIYGGTVTVTGGINSAGIGGGQGSSGAEVAIYGGTVTASGGPEESGKDPTVGIGAGYSKSDLSNGNLTLGKGVRMKVSTDNSEWDAYNGSTRLRYMKSDYDPHEHSFTYAASGATITATCKAGCPDNYYTTPATLTITAPTLTTYGETGKSEAATLDGLAGFNTATGKSIAATDIQYFNATKNGSTYNKSGDALSAAPTGAGDYVAEITVESKTASVGYTIDKADPTAPTGLTATYGQTLADVVGLTEGWSWVPAATTSVGSVGSNTFQANFAENDNYNAASNVEVTVTVSKATATTEMQEASVSIAGTSGKTATVSYTLPDGASYGTVTNSNTEFFTVDTTSGLVLTAEKNWTASDWATDAPKTFTVAVSDATNYNDYTLTVTVTPTYKQTQTITASDVTATYGDTDVKIEATTTSGGGALSYAVKSGEAVTVSETTGALTIVKAGSAVITVTAAENDTYAAATKDVNVTVNTKAMTVSAEDVNVTVDGQPHGITVNVTDPATGATVKYGTTEGTYDQTTSPTQTGVGEKTVYYQVTADNYTTYTGSAKVTVNAKQTQTITASDVTATYGDTGKKIEASTNGNGAISYAVKDGSADYIDVDTSTGALTIKKVGTATVIVTAAETDTYAQVTKEVTVTINKANAIPATATANNRTYDGTEKPLVTVTGEVTGGEMRYAVTTENVAPTDDNLYTTSIPTATNAGTYYVWYKAKGDNNHTDSDVASVIATIGKAAISYQAGDYTGTYDGSEHSITVTVNVPASGVTVEYGTKEGTCNLTTAPIYKNAGTYKVYYQISADNYETVKGSADVVIGKKALSITADAKTKAYGGEDPALTYTGAGLVEGDEITGALTREQGEDAGSYRITQGTLSAGDNYTVTYTGADLTITRPAAEARAELPRLESFTYDGTEKTGVAAGEGYTLSGELAAKDAGTYVVTAKLAEGYTAWADGTTEEKKLSWLIRKRVQDAPEVTVAEGTDDAVEVQIPSGKTVKYTSDLTKDRAEWDTAQTTVSGLKPGTWYFIVEGSKNELDSPVTVATVSRPTISSRTMQPSALAKDSVTLNGIAAPENYITDEYVESVSFLYREKGAAEWTQTGEAAPAGRFEKALTGLKEDTDYEYMAAVKVKDAETPEYGEIIVFHTLRTENTGSIGVEVRSEEKREVIVSIEEGNDVLASMKPDENGKAEFTCLPDGSYNVVVRSADGDYTETRMITVENGSAVAVVFEVPVGKMATVVEVKEGAPKAAVEGLNDILTPADKEDTAKGLKDVEIRLEVEEKAADKADGADEIRELLGKEEKVDTFLDLSLYKTTTDLDAEGNATSIDTENIGAENTKVVEIAIPYSAAKTGTFRMYRYHNRIAEPLSVLAKRAASAFADGTYFVDKSRGYIYLYASGFSTYAIIQEAGDSGENSGSTPENPSGQDGTETQDSSETQSQDSTETAGQDSTESASQDNTETAGQDSTETTDQDSTETTDQDSSETKGQDSTETTGQDSSETTGQDSSETTGQDNTETQGQDSTETTGQDNTETQDSTKTQDKTESSTQKTTEKQTQGTTQKPTQGTTSASSGKTGTTEKPASVKTYSVTFKANGGSGTMAVQKITGKAKLAANSFTFDEHQFDGWNTQADGKGTAYSDQAEVTPKADLTLYAQWKQAELSAEAAEKKAGLDINAKLKAYHRGSRVDVTWGKVEGADRYRIYSTYCGNSKYELVKTVKGSAKLKITYDKLKGRKLSPYKHVKLYIVAEKAVKKNGKTTWQQLTKTITAHIVGKKNEKFSNVKKIKLTRTSYTLKVGKKAKIKAKTVLQYPGRKQLGNAHAKEFRYATTDETIATVDAKGRIKGVGEGSCTVYVYARNGLARKVTVTVKP